ncbi:general substrate transporter [Mucidula mucida]|nr:general substrate transporter [Mucidula mucida]
MAPGAVAAANIAGFSHLIHPDKRWYNNRRILALNGWIVLLLVTASTNGYDGSMMNGLQSLTQWADYFGHPTGGKLGLLNAIQNIGALAAYPFAPYISDGIGRRPTVALGAAIMVVATVIQTASQSVGMFIGARFLIGFGLTFAVSYPTHRAPLTSAYNSLWYSGSIIAAWTTFGTFKIHNTWAWRVPSALQALPSVFQVLLVWFAPESPRWLISKGREEEALKTLAYYHADGNQDDPLVRFEFNEIKAALEFDRNVAANVGWKALIQTPGNRKRMNIIVAIAFFSQWSGNGIASYYLNKVLKDIGIPNPTTQLLINGILQIWNLAWALVASSLVNKLGRRLMFLTSAVGMFVFFSCQTICFAVFSETGKKGSAYALIAFIFLFFAAYDIAFTPLIVTYTVEIMPFALRAKGLNVFNFTISVALIFNQYVNPIALDNIGWKYYIVYVVWIAFEFAFLYKYVVETKNLSLEETAALFDGEEATQELAHAHVEGGVVPKEAIDEKSSGSSMHEAAEVPNLKK